MSGGMILLIAVDTLDCILWFGYLVGVAGTSPSDSSVCSARHPYPNYGGGCPWPKLYRLLPHELFHGQCDNVNGHGGG